MTRTLSSDEQAAIHRLLVAEAWRRADLTYLLHSGQRKLKRSALERTETGRFRWSRYVLEIARRWGKTFFLCTVALETCLRKPRARVAYAAMTTKDLTEFILPTLEAISADAPEELRGKYVKASGHWQLPNGSYIHLFGCDDKRKANRGRGPAADLAIVDEAGFISILGYVIKSILKPQLLDSKGMLLLASSPSEEPDHPFSEVAKRAEERGNYARATVWDNPRHTEADLQAFLAEDAADEGLSPEEYQETDTFRREYLAERVVNKMLMVIPEWLEEREKLLVERERPKYFDAYESLDMGGADPHFLLFGYWDFPRGVLYIEDELCLTEGENTADVAAAVKAKEQALWGVNKWEGALRGIHEKDEELLANLPDWMADSVRRESQRQPYARYSDHNLQMVKDLYELHRLAFIPTEKTEKRLHVDALRVAVRRGTVEVNPRCESLDLHLSTTMWKDHKRREFARTKGHHGDGIDALTYMRRNVRETRNPWPKGYQPPPGTADRLKRIEEVGERLTRTLWGTGPGRKTPPGRR
jgi:hypothetical protein